MTTRTKRAPKTVEAEPAPKPRRTRKPAEPAPTPKPATGPRGEHLDRHGVVLPDGSTLRLAFAEFELLQHPDRQGWVVRCVAHDSLSESLATKALAERAGARKARAGWCKVCAKAAK